VAGNEIAPADVPKHQDWSKWTIEHAVQAITGDSVDLTRLVDKQWFTFIPESVGNTWDFKPHSDKPSTKGEMEYHAFGKQYYGANIDHQAITNFQDGVDKFVKIGPGLHNGVSGELDAGTLNGLRDKIVELQQFLNDRARQYRQWAKLLDSNAADFHGKAAAVIQSRVDNYADSLEHWGRQLDYNYNRPLVDAVAEAAAALNAFDYKASAGIDFLSTNKARDAVQTAVNQKINEIYNYLNYWGLIISNPNNYYLDQGNQNGFLEDVRTRILQQAEAWYRAAGGTDDGWIELGEAEWKKWDAWYIDQVMAHFRTGDLRTPGAWDTMNKEITAYAQVLLFGADMFTRDAIKVVYEKYQILGRSFHTLDPPRPLRPQFGPNGLGGGLGNSLFPDGVFPNGMFDGMFPNGMFDGVFPNGMFDGMFPNGMFDGAFPNGMFDGAFPNGMFDGAFPNGMFDGMFPNGMFGQGSPNGVGFGAGPNASGSPYPNYPGYPNMDAFGGPPYSSYGNIRPYPDMSNVAVPSPYGNYSPGDFAPGGSAPGAFTPGTGNVGPGDFAPGGSAPGAFTPGMANVGPGDFAPGAFTPGVSNFSPGGSVFSPGPFPGTSLPPGSDLGPHGELLGPDGQPQLGPNGELVGPDGKPVLGPFGQILGPGGRSLLGPNGELLGPDGQPLLGPQGQLLGPDGQPLLGPQGQLLGPDGQSLLGPNGQLLGPDGQSLLGPQGQLLGPDGQSLLGPQGQLLGPDGQSLLGPQGQLLGPGGAPILGADGKPILGANVPPGGFDPGQFLPGGVPGGVPGGSSGVFDPGTFVPGGAPGGGAFDPGGSFVPGGASGLGPGSGSLDPGRFLDPGSFDPKTFSPPSSRLDLPLDAYKSALQPPPAYQPGAGVQLDSNGLAIPPGAESGAGPGGSPSSAAGPGGMGGMPFMPPMGGGMGGMGGGPGGSKEERERQTWLSEDEEVWGTSVAAGAAVIGRPDEDEDEFDPDELILPAGPVRTPRPGTPVPARAGTATRGGTETAGEAPETGGGDRRDDAATQRG
jgi:hypothetical protein